jgi:homoserine/homoserine lactone efflux protein
MSMEGYLALIGATAVLVAIPGPNVAMIVATSLSRGTRFGLLTVAGTTLGVAAQLVFLVIGLSALIDTMAAVFEWLRWAGVAYLLYLGMRAWNAPAEDLSTIEADQSPGNATFWGGFGVALVNPKTLLFNSAFLPQFVSADSDVSIGAQLFLVSAIFLGVLALGDCAWALIAGRARTLISRYGNLRNKVGGAVLLSAGATLALSRR